MSRPIEMTHADSPHPAVAATVSLGSAAFTFLSNAEPVLSAVASIIAIVSGLLAAFWYAVSIYKKIRE